MGVNEDTKTMGPPLVETQISPRSNEDDSPLRLKQQFSRTNKGSQPQDKGNSLGLASHNVINLMQNISHTSPDTAYK